MGWRDSHLVRRLCTRKPVDEIQADHEKSVYRKHLGVLDLVAIGVGGIVGAGIFVLTGKAAKQNAGPGIVIAFVCAGFISSLAAMCYSELASSLPVSGSAYSFTYAALGELLAWIIGWDLMLEYLVGSATVAVGWSAYLNVLQTSLNNVTGSSYVFNPRWMNSPFVWLEKGQTYPWDPSSQTDHAGFWKNKVHMSDGSFQEPIINLPALSIVLFITSLLCFGIKEGARFNNCVVVFKLVVIVVVIFGGIAYIDPANYTPFVPANTGVRAQYGASGVIEATVSVFFAFIGFDSVTTVTQESKNPQRDIPIGVLGSLFVCTLLYIGVSLVLVGMINYTEIDMGAPIGHAFTTVGHPGLAIFINFGALAGLTSVLLTLLIGQPRIFQAMAADGLFPPMFAWISSRGAPWVSTLSAGLFCSALAAVLPVDLLGNLTSVGTLFAFAMVSLSVVVLRISNPDLPRKFKIPGPQWFGFGVAGLSSLCSFGLLLSASAASIARVFIWMFIGLMIYFCYGYRHSRVGLVVDQSNALTSRSDLTSDANMTPEDFAVSSSLDDELDHGDGEGLELSEVRR
eukprot:gb/GEZN01004653.1/.p1 GENE.gb/GEZN01004653.1/~~gb/GEZN01004653.1/.p1  ORF type:complete len:569 (-),score=72.12 gb/GEZN01004653.1/:142-1848(-)